ncbi:MAG: response regulator [Acidobacteriota bacterium]
MSRGRPEPFNNQKESMAMAQANRILVADDESSVREILRRFLEERGFQVETAADGEEALAIIRQGQTDLLLLDLKMPKLDGLELLQRIEEEGLEVAVITISGAADEETARESLRRGAADFITKPFDLMYLETSLMAKLLLLEG